MERYTLSAHEPSAHCIRSKEVQSLNFISSKGPKKVLITWANMLHGHEMKCTRCISQTVIAGEISLSENKMISRNVFYYYFSSRFCGFKFSL